MFGIIGTYLNISGIVPDRELLGLLAGAVIIVALGVIDDIKQLGPKIKLLVQIIAALTCVLISGTRIVNITNPFVESGTTQFSDFVSYPLTIIWIVGVTNAVNLIDGLDGLAAGVSSISYLSLFFVSLITGDVDSALITVILAGSTLGFYRTILTRRRYLWETLEQPFGFYPFNYFYSGNAQVLCCSFDCSSVACTGTSIV